jgi:hypothetical protein
MTNTASETARSAATYIREHGLAQHGLLTAEGKACFNGALLIALSGPGYKLPEDQLELWNAIGGFAGKRAPNPAWDNFVCIESSAMGILRERGSGAANPVAWNNEHGRTSEEVAQLLEEVATILETVGQ